MLERASSIFKAAVDAVTPCQLIRKALAVDGDQLTLLPNNARYAVGQNVYVAAFGKAACGMSRAVDDLLHEHIKSGVASIPFGTLDAYRREGKTSLLPRKGTKIQYYEGAYGNKPDDAAYRAAQATKNMIAQLTGNDLLLVLVSGGGSALLPCPVQGLTLEDKTRISKLLSARGANIEQLNTVLTHLSELKGGRLAQLAAGARRIVALILSDVIGDRLQFVASGPTVVSDTRPSDALKIIEQFCGSETESKDIPPDVFTILRNLVEKEKQQPISPTSVNNIDNLLIGSNRIALTAAKAAAERMGYHAEIIDDQLSGVASIVGRSLAEKLETTINEDARKMDAGQEPLPRCFLFGGETVVRVHGNGRGGRSQELVLSFVIETLRRQLTTGQRSSSGQRPFAFLSAGTDGQDGATDAAGAVVTSDELFGVDQSEVQRMEDALNRNDSYTFFAGFHHGKCHLRGGHTGTNVMDIQVLLVGRPDR